MMCRGVVLSLVAATVAAAQPNLVINGDFESGLSTDWTAWGAGWGSNDPPEYNNTQAGRIGNYCLKLSTTASHSFGIYQEVPVVAGRTYKLDAYWKGTHHGEKNWYELILIDGPWSLAAADDPVIDQPHKIYAYDYPNYPPTADFGWAWGHSLDYTAGDWNGYHGVRTASGNVMTVVLKAGACCPNPNATAWFDNVTLTEAPTAPAHTCTFRNGNFADSLNHWSSWTLRDGNSDGSVVVDAGVLSISGSDSEAGMYQAFEIGTPGSIVTVTGEWSSGPALSDAMWAEVWAINADRVPVDGVPETDGANDAILLYRNDTFDGRNSWDGPIPKNAPVKYQVSFVAAGSWATLILKAGNTGPNTPTGVQFDNIEVRCVPPAATMASLPSGFTGRTYTFPVTNMVSMAQSPVSRLIYAISNDSNTSGTRLYRVNVDDANLSTTQISGLGSLVNYAQGLTFDPAGNLYISTQYGKIIKGTDTNPDPAVDSFSFVNILTMPPLEIGTFHGVGGIAVGPDDLLYINSGSESHYGYLSNGQPEVFDGRLNARILRCDLDGSNLEEYAGGIRNTFDITFRQDGKLFGVENGPNTSCDYAEEFNLLEAGHHYGFPYKYGSDLSGSDSSYVCTSVGTPGPPPLPEGLTVTPSWANYGPDAKPGPGQPGYADGGVYYGFDPHCSPDGVDFYEPTLMDPAAIKFPSEFHHRAFVARFGNLEPVPGVGFDVVSLRLDEAAQGFVCNRFLSSLGRAIDVLCAYNGKLYVLEYNQQSSPSGGGWGQPSKLYEIAYTVPSEPQISVMPATLSRSIYVGQSLPDDSFTVSNAGTGTIEFSIGVDFDPVVGMPWLEVSPTAGSSSGPADETVGAITYDVAALPVGTYAATITVSDPAVSNSPQTLAVMLEVKTIAPDFDKDGDVDLADYGHLQECLSGDGLTPSVANCDDAKLDGDSDVDAYDWAIFAGCLSGPNVAPVWSCMDN